MLSTSTLSFETLLDRLTRKPEEPNSTPLTVQQLYNFSDLSEREAAQLRSRWPDIPAAQRVSILTQLTDAAHDELTLHLGRLLRIAVEDENADVRRLAINGLWEETSSDLVGPLLRRLLDDEASEVRAAAAQALGSYVLAGELEEISGALAMRVEEALLSVVHNRTEMLDARRHALESLAFSSETGIRHLIEDAYYSPYQEMRQSALVAMGRSADVRWRSLVRVELGNPAPEMRIEAARACGELEAHQALEDLFLLLEDQEAAVRQAVIFALGRIGGQEATEALRLIANSDKEDAEALAVQFTDEEIEAAELALEEMSFYEGMEEIGLLDEEVDEDDFDEDGFWYDLDDRQPGVYE